jgi:hypothetical protein
MFLLQGSKVKAELNKSSWGFATKRFDGFFLPFAEKS